MGLLFCSAFALAAGCGGSGSSAAGAPSEADFDPSLAGGSDDESDASEQTDSGSRPGRTDAGARDAGTRDAGGGDGGSADAGRLDAGVVRDAGPLADGPDIDAALAQEDARTGEFGSLAAEERLLVADGKAARVYALDAPGRRVLDTLPVSGKGTVRAGASGRFGYVLEREANVVHVVDMGLMDPTGASASAAVQPPQLLLPGISGSAPTAFSTQTGGVLLFFAGGSGAELRAYADGAGAAAATTSAGAMHDGFALQVGNRVLTTYAESSGAPQLKLLDTGFTPQSAPAFGCTEPRTGAVAQNVAALACREGVVRYSPSSASVKTVALPAAGGAQASVERLVAHPHDATFLALYDGQLCVIGDSAHCVAQPQGGVADLAFDAAGKRVLALTPSGTLHIYLPDTLESLAPVALFTLNGAASGPDTPQLAVGRSAVYASDPSHGSIHIVDVAKGKRVDTISIPDAAPTSIAVFRYPD